MGLYRTDCLAIIQPKNNKDLGNKKKVFKDIGYKIMIDTYATICNFLDLTLDLTTIY